MKNLGLATSCAVLLAWLAVLGFGAAPAWGKVLSVKVLAPDSVVTTDPFRVEIHVTVDVGNVPEPSIPTIPGMALNLLGNEHRTLIDFSGKITKVFSYVGRVTRKGTFELKGIQSGGVPAQPRRINAVDASEVAKVPPGKKRPPIFLEAVVDKTEVWQGAQLTYDLYLYVSNVDFLRPPRANIEEVLQPFGARKVDPSLIPKGSQMVTLDGTRYERLLGARYVIYPLEPGEITIPPVRLQGQVQASRRRGSNDLFEQFFSFTQGVDADQVAGGPILSQPIKVNVRPLPEEGRPANFSGAVGQAFTFAASLSKRQVSVGESFNLSLTIKGNGNLDSVKQPDLKFPEWIEIFESDRKADSFYKDDRYFGEVTYDYVLIPRKEGKVILNPVEFSYFGSADGKYVTLKQGPFSLEVTPDEGQSVTYLQGKRKRIRVVGEDFRHIRTAGVKLVDEGAPAHQSASFWTVFAGPWLLLLGAVAKRRREEYLLQHPAVSERIRAKGSARSRLSRAEGLLGSDDGEFYSELEAAIHELLSAQLGIATRGLTRDQLAENLAGRARGKGTRLTPELLHRLVDTLEEMDQLRFSPGSDGPTKRSGILERTRGILSDVKRLG